MNSLTSCGKFLAILITVSQLASAQTATQDAQQLQTPQGLDIAPFGYVVTGDDGRSYGIRWAEPRKVRQVVVEFDPAGLAAGQPQTDDLKLQYWQRVWNGRPDPVLAERGAGGVGWDSMDDWTNGKWIDAKVQLCKKENLWTFGMAPMEAGEITDSGVLYRKTLQVRLLAKTPLQNIRAMHVYTESLPRPLQVQIHFRKPDKEQFTKDGAETGRLEAFNGQVSAVRPLSGSGVTVDDKMQWTLPADGTGGIEADILMATDPTDARYDRTIVTVRSDVRPFSFAADEISRGGRILVDDLGVLVTRADDTIGLTSYREALKRELGGRTVYDRVKGHEEQMLMGAWDDMPLKRPLWFVHGLPGNRNTIRQQPNGDIEISAVRRWFDVQRSPRDSDRKLWKGEWLRVCFGLPDEQLRGGRELHDGYLPILRTWWQTGPIYYEQTTVLTTFDGDLDDPTVLLARIRAVNTSASQQSTAQLRLRTEADGTEHLTLERDRAFAQTDKGNHFRFLVLAPPDRLSQSDNAVLWSASLAPGQSDQLDVIIPSVTLAGDEQINLLRELQFDSEVKKLCEFWQQLTARGAQISTPEPWINDFYKAHTRHLLVNCFKDLNSDLLYAHVGTFHYGVYPSESVMMISDLDRRGYHDEAARNLNMFLQYQGTVSMPGNFKSKAGQFYGANGHETGGYNKSHGYVLWAMAYHWQLTRDRNWMQQAADKLVESCNWVSRERQATMTKRPDGSKSLEYGWLPTGSLEDVTDYWNWLATNSATVWGFRALADALADFGHPEGQRLQKEAQAYYEDFLRGINEAQILAPVVQLRDGTYVPKIPSRLYERGRAHGWLRETLEGAVFLPAYQLLDPHSPQTEWILKDYEDNLYISDRFGYAIPAYEDFWFSRGGFSMQANLLDGPLPYLWRDDVKHFIRAYFNGFASAFYPELRMCNEHSLPELGYPAGDLFKTSDEAQSTYWLRLMFINEQGRDLYLGQAIPRYWLADGNKCSITRAPSHFGVLSLAYESHAVTGKINVTFEPPTRNSPDKILLRIRHPQAKPIKAVSINDKSWQDFDADKEWIILPGNLQGTQRIAVQY
jgi:hypothetical protein